MRRLGKVLGTVSLVAWFGATQGPLQAGVDTAGQAAAGIDQCFTKLTARYADLEFGSVGQ